MAGLSKRELFRDVEIYAERHGLTDALPYLKKGALVAQRPEDYMHLEELDQSDIEVLRMEQTKRWHQPVTLYALIALNSVGAGKSWSRDLARA